MFSRQPQIIYVLMYVFIGFSYLLFSAIEYDFVDLGAGFEPHKINNQSQIVGTLKYSKPFLPNFEKAALWNKQCGLLIIESEENISTSAHGINEQGQIVGMASFPPPFLDIDQPVLWNSEKENYVSLVYSDASPSPATAINNSSLICGYAFPRFSQNPHAFVWHENTGITDLHPSTEGASKAHDINNKGQVVGELSYETNTLNPKQFAFQWTPLEGIQLLNIPGDFSRAYGNNENGDIVGSYGYYNRSEGAFLYKVDGTFRDLGGLWTVAYSINNQGEIVGSGISSERFQKEKSAFIWKAGKIKSLNKLVDNKAKWWLTEATDINEKGEIIGIAINEDDESIQHGFLLLPRTTPLFQADPGKTYKCIFLSLENNGPKSFPERSFVFIPGEKINEINEYGKAWCQPLDMIDLDREGETTYQHDKLYEVVLMYISGQSAKTFTSLDYLRQNKYETKLQNAKPGDVFLVPGYFLNDWNNRVNPTTGEVFYWFQPTELLSQSIKFKMIEYAKKSQTF